MWLQRSTQYLRKTTGLFSLTVDAWLNRPRDPNIQWPETAEEAPNNQETSDQEKTEPVSMGHQRAESPLPSQRLIRLGAGQPHDSWQLPQDRPAFVGRSAPGQIVALDVDLGPDAAVSRVHARLWYAEEHWWIEDLRSTNGTWVDQQDIRGLGAIPLSLGSTIQIGQTVLLFDSQQ